MKHTSAIICGAGIERGEAWAADRMSMEFTSGLVAGISVGIEVEN